MILKILQSKKFRELAHEKKEDDNNYIKIHSYLKHMQLKKVKIYVTILEIVQ